MAEPEEEGEKLMDVEVIMMGWPTDWPKYFNQSENPCDKAIGVCICGNAHAADEFQFKGGTLYRFGKFVGGFKPEHIVKEECFQSIKYDERVWLQKLANGLADYGNGRKVRLGSVAGSPDSYGGVSFVIRPEHVGMTILQFVEVEFKGEGPDNTDPKRKEQQSTHINHVRRLGGRAGYARSVSEFKAILGLDEIQEYK